MKQIVRKSIFSRLIIIIAGASIISVIITSIGHYLLVSDLFRNLIHEQAKSTLNTAKHLLLDENQLYIEHDLRLLQQSPLIKKALLTANTKRNRFEQVNLLFENFIHQGNSRYEGILLIDENKKILTAVYSNTTTLQKKDDLARLNIKELASKLDFQAPGSVLFIGPHKYGKKNLFFAGVKLTDLTKRTSDAKVIISFNLSKFYEELDSHTVSGKPVTWFFTQTGRPLHKPKGESILDPHPYTFKGRDPHRNFIIKASKPEGDNNLTNLTRIVISLPPEIINNALLNSIFATALFVFMVSIAVISIAYYTANKILSPIKKLTTLSQKVASGDFNVRMPIITKDEIGTLSQAFNIMIQELDEQRYELQSLANKDTLTQLPNRRQFEEHLSLLIKNCNRNNQSIAVMYIDLDQFKDTNDTFGHPAGDKLIRDVSSRLLKTVRQSDLVARLGGDEFAIIINPHKTKTDTEFVARKILDHLSKPFTIEGQQIFSGASIGISTYPEHGENATTLVKNADAAMYKAKNTGRNNHQFYSENLTEKANERIVLGSLIRHALTSNQFELYFQPKVDLTTKTITGAEALLRWQHQGRMILPSKIINIAEESGFIEKIDAWVINKSCELIEQWQAKEINIVPISINISGRLLENNKVINLLKNGLHQHLIDPKWIEIEITENDLIRNHEQTQKTLKVIHSLGVKIAIDDFGTGYSSLSYLKDLLADTLKIDRKFVVNAMENYADKEIASAIVKLAIALHMEVVVEGIETQEQEQFFKKLGAQLGQGYLYSKPMAFEQFTQHVSSITMGHMLVEKHNNSEKPRA